MIVARIPVGEDDSVGDRLGEWNILQGGKYSNDLAGEQYFVGRKALCWNVDGNSAGEWTDEEMTLWGVYTLLEDLLIWRNKNSAGDELLLLVIVNPVGDRKNFAGGQASRVYWGRRVVVL